MIDENRDHHTLRAFTRLGHKLEVTGMQRAHGWNQCNAFSGVAPGRKRAAEGGNCARNSGSVRHGGGLIGTSR